jgi:predicted TIM-barrel fold metal-dependent hydrolase
MLDFHAHIGNLARESYPDRPALTPEQMLDRMDRSGIEMAVLQPLESPEGGWGYSLTEDVITARDKYPERFIAFVCIDPRYPRAAELTGIFVTRYGCKGFGEHVNSLPFDHELNRALYAKCDELGLPLVFGDDLGCFDEPGLPRLERCLQEFPNCKFCGHGPGFWSAISGDDDRTIVYPTTPTKPGGALDRLLAEYENLYLDLSAGSGYNAMTRDPEFTLGFIERHWQRCLWGTDYCLVHQETPQVEWLALLPVTDEVRYAIGEGNARRVLGL